jgi:lactoylglutathione lyase
VPASNVRAVLLHFCGVGLELIESPATATRGPDQLSSDRAHITFAVGSADAVGTLTTRLAAAGHPVPEPHRSCREACYESVVLDPDGDPIALTV